MGLEGVKFTVTVPPYDLLTLLLRYAPDQHYQSRQRYQNHQPQPQPQPPQPLVALIRLWALEPRIWRGEVNGWADLVSE